MGLARRGEGGKAEATFDDVLFSVSIPLAEEGTSESIKVQGKES